MGVSVTGRIKAIKQPRGGYINPKSMKLVQMNDGVEMGAEDLHASTVGLAVDYLTRFMLEGRVEEAFHISLLGGMRIGRIEEVFGYLEKINGLDDASITNACRASMFDVCFRAGLPLSSEPSNLEVSVQTCANIRTMVNRSIKFFDDCGPITVFGFTFRGGYTDVVSAGDGDYLTESTLWDLKTSKNPPSKEHTLQLAMYYIMGKHSVESAFDSVENVGIFNPRLNAMYTLSMKTIPADVLRDIEINVIGYSGKECIDWNCRV